MQSERVGIILAGGRGTRLTPLTLSTSKQLLPVYDKPMIFYPLTTMMQAGIRDIIIITTPESQIQFIGLLGTGKRFGVNITYITQDKPNGIAEAFILAEKHIKGKSVCLILGDNIFYGSSLPKKLAEIPATSNEAIVFASHVKDPERYGVIEIDEESHRVLSIEEKPKNPKSNYAVTGLYFYPNDVVDMVKKLNKSERGEYEITDLNKLYLEQQRLCVVRMNRGTAWLDAGTPSSLADSTNFVRTISERQGIMIGCPEEIGINNGWVDTVFLKRYCKHMYGSSDYGKYIMSLISKEFL